MELDKELFLLTLFSLFILFIPQADAATVTVSAPQGSGVPGCEDTNQCFIPSSIFINAGDTVLWSNDDTAAHTVTSGTASDGPDGVFDSSLFMAGTTFSHTFDEDGTYEYFCMVHPWMVGVVSVGPPIIPPIPEPEPTCGPGTVLKNGICVVEQVSTGGSSDESFPIVYVIVGIVIAVIATVAIALSKRKKAAPVISISPTKVPATPVTDDTQFWVCPHCGGDTQYRNEKQFCPSCNMYL